MRLRCKMAVFAASVFAAFALGGAIVCAGGKTESVSAAEPVGSIEFSIAELGDDTTWTFSGDRICLDIVTNENVVFTDENVRVPSTPSLTIDGVEFSWAVPAASFAQVFEGGRLHILLKYSPGIDYNGNAWYSDSYPGLEAGVEHVIEFKAGMTIGAYKLTENYTVTVTADKKFVQDIEIAPDMTNIGGPQDTESTMRTLVRLNSFGREYFSSSVAAEIDGERRTVQVTNVGQDGQLLLLLPYTVCPKEDTHIVRIPKGTVIPGHTGNEFSIRFADDLWLYIENGQPYALNDFMPETDESYIGGMQENLNRYLVYLNTLAEKISGTAVTVYVDGAEKQATIDAGENGKLMLLLPFDICDAKNPHEVILPGGVILKSGVVKSVWRTSKDLSVYIKGGMLCADATPSVSVSFGGAPLTDGVVTVEEGSTASLAATGTDCFGDALTAEIYGFDQAVRDGKFVRRAGEEQSVYTVTVSVMDGRYGASASRTIEITVIACPHTSYGEWAANEAGNGIVRMCGQCGAEQEILLSVGATLTVEDEVKVNYILQPIVPEGVTADISARIIVYESADTQEGKTISMTSDGNGVYRAENIRSYAAKEIGDSHWFEAESAVNGVELKTVKREYSPAIYAMNKLNEEGGFDATKNLALSLLDYASAAQVYFGYRTDALANAGVTAEMRAAAEAYRETVYTEYMPYEGQVFDEGEEFIAAAGMSLNLDGKVSVNGYLVAEAGATAEMKIYVDEASAKMDADAQETVPMAYADGRYKGTTQSTLFAAKEFGDAVYIVFYVNGEAVTPVLRYGVKDYAYRMLGKEPTAEEKTLYESLLNYAAAAQIAFGYNTEDLANAGLRRTEE